jgi:hypothetical protein
MALGLGVGAGTFALFDDDYWSVCDARRVFAYRLEKPLRSQESNLVYRVVERGSRGDHGCSGRHRSGRTGSSVGRCACAHSRGDRTSSVNAADRASSSVTATPVSVATGSPSDTGGRSFVVSALLPEKRTPSKTVVMSTKCRDRTLTARYSNASSAWTTKVSGTARPSFLAPLTLRASSKVTGCCGSAGRRPYFFARSMT